MARAVRSILRTLGGALRTSRWGVLVTIASWLVFFFIYTTTDTAHTPGSDGHYTWLYARSLVYDHDIEFKNDYALCGDPYEKNVDRGAGHPDNPFYIGPAVVWAPLLWTLRLVEPLPPEAPEVERVACRGRLTAHTLSVGPWLAAGAVFLMYRLGRRFARDGEAALAAGLLGLGSSLPAYAGIWPAYSHVYDTFFAALTMILSVRAGERPRSAPRWALVGAALGLGLLQRPVSVVYGAVPAALAVATLWKQWRPLAAALGLLGVGSLLYGALPQMLVYQFLYGRPWVGAPHGRFYMQYAHAHPWLVLFAPHGGFFYVAPTAWLAVAGGVWAVRSRATRPLALGILVASALAVWLSAAPLDWHSSGTFGARRLTSLLPVLAPLEAVAVARIARWVAARRSRALVALGFAVLLPVAFTIGGAAYGLGQARVSTERGLSQSEIYGEGEKVGWDVVNDHVGDLAILPAELVYELRFGVPMNTFRDATEPFYERNYRTMAFSMTEIDLGDGRVRRTLRGLEGRKEGARMTGPRSSMLFSVQWPFATQLTIKAQAAHATRVRVGRGRLFGVTWYGDFPVSERQSSASVAIPAGGFDSGLLELVFQCADAPRAGVVLSSVKIEDQNPYPPPLQF